MSDGLDEDLARQLIAGQAVTKERFEELFRRLDKVENTAVSGLNMATEIALVLREQNALSRITEVREEAHKIVEGLRQDFVLAQTNLRKDVLQLREKVEAFETLKTTGAGMAKGAKFAFEAGKWIVAAGGGALLVKAMGG